MLTTLLAKYIGCPERGVVAGYFGNGKTKKSRMIGKGAILRKAFIIAIALFALALALAASHSGSNTYSGGPTPAATPTPK